MEFLCLNRVLCFFWFLSLFNDLCRFLGYFQPQEGKPALWDLDSDYHLHVSGFLDDLMPERYSLSSHRCNMAIFRAKLGGRDINVIYNVKLYFSSYILVNFVV